MRSKKTIRISFGIVFLTLGFSFSFVPIKKNKTDKLILNIKHFVGNLPLKMDSVTYKNKLGQNFTITKFKYYISNIVLKQENGNEFKSDNYFLVDEEVENSKQLVLENVPDGTYTSIEFIIGVDSLHNCSGAQSGALDPINGMFWAWNSGYIFLKLEGFSSSSKSPGHLYEYHIGGYKQPNNCIRKVFLDLDKIDITKTTAFFLKADAEELLENPTSIDFEKLSSVTDHRNAPGIADNYKDMFSILKNN